PSQPRLPPRSPARAWSPRKRSSRRRWPHPRGARRGSGARPARWRCCASSRRACRQRSASTWTSSPSSATASCSTAAPRASTRSTRSAARSPPRRSWPTSRPTRRAPRSTAGGSSSGCGRRGSRPWERAREAPRRLARRPLRTRADAGRRGGRHGRPRPGRAQRARPARRPGDAARARRRARARAGRRAARRRDAPPRRRAGRRRGRRCARAARAPGGGGQRRRRTGAHREHDARGRRGGGRTGRGARRARRAGHLARRHRPPPPSARDGGAAAPRRAPRAAQAPGRSRALRCDRRGGRAARRAVRLGRILLAGAIFAGVVALTFPTDALVRWALARALPPGGLRLDFDHAMLRPWGVRLAPVTLRDATGYRVAAADWLVAHPSLLGFLGDPAGRPWRVNGTAYGGTFTAVVSRRVTLLEWHDLDLARVPTLKVGGDHVGGTTEGAATLRGASGEGTLGVRGMTWPSAARFLLGAETMPVDATVWWTL